MFVSFVIRWAYDGISDICWGWCIDGRYRTYWWICTICCTINWRTQSFIFKAKTNTGLNLIDHLFYTFLWSHRLWLFTKVLFYDHENVCGMRTCIKKRVPIKGCAWLLVGYSEVLLWKFWNYNHRPNLLHARGEKRSRNIFNMFRYKQYKRVWVE